MAALFKKLAISGTVLFVFGCTTRSQLRPCDFFAEDNGWTNLSRCYREIPKTLGHVDPNVLPLLPYEADTKLASIHLFDGFAYVDRDGAILIRGVMMMDNGADPFIEGLVRFKRDGKIRFANAKGEVVIPPRHDGALSFERGHAKVCVGCTEETIDEYHHYTGGYWRCLDMHGKIAEQEKCNP